MKTIIAIFLLLLAAMARDKNWNLLKILLFFAAVGLFVSHAIDFLVINFCWLMCMEEKFDYTLSKRVRGGNMKKFVKDDE